MERDFIPTPVIPQAMTHKELSSTGEHIVRRYKKEFLPMSQQDYSFSGSNVIEFHLASTSEALDQLYIRTNFRTTGTSDGSTNDFRRALEQGGLSNCIERIEIRSIDGVEIDQMEDYGRHYNILSNIYQDDEHINAVEWQSGDSEWKNVVNNLLEDKSRLKPLTGGWTLVADDETIASAGTNGAATTEMRVGDFVQARNSSDVVVYEGRVHTITNDDSIEVYPAPDQAVAGDGATLFGYRRIESSEACSPDNTALTTSGKLLNKRLFIPLLSGHNEMFPLYACQGLIIRITLRNPVHALNSTVLGASATLDYQWSDVRLVGEMVVPSQYVMSETLKSRANGTLQYAWPSYQWRQFVVSGAQGDIDINIPASRQSVNKLYFTIQNSRAINTIASASALTDCYSYPSNTFIDGGLSEYEAVIGGTNFPQRPINTSDSFMTEAYHELSKTFGLFGNSAVKHRFTLQEFGKFNKNSDDGAYNSSKKAIFCINFAKDVHDLFSGVSTKNDPNVNLRLTTNAAHKVNGSESSRYIQTYLEYPRTIRIDASGRVKKFN